jgi:hypothetical protein
MLELGVDSTVSRVRGAHVDRRATSVPATTLGSVLREQSIGPFVLISDIEGAEAGIIFDDRESLADCRQIIVELHRTTYKGTLYEPDDLAAAIEARGFQLIGKDGGVWSFASDTAS